MPPMKVDIRNLTRAVKYDINKNLTIGTKNLVNRIYESITSKSPVDTGTFRYNTHVYLNVEEHPSTIPAPAKPSYSSPPTTAERSNSGIEEAMTGFVLGDRVIISNMVYYADKVELLGWLKKSPYMPFRLGMEYVRPTAHLSYKKGATDRRSES